MTGIDLNVIKLFVAVYETRSLTLASERLFVTPSAVSQSLARLRTQFDDPLFERAGREMRPTRLAAAIYPGFQEALTRINRTLEDVHGFDPATSERVLRIALSELGEIGWLPLLLRAIRRRAPRVRVEVVPLGTEPLAQWLERGVVDLAVTPEDLPGVFTRMRVKTQSYCVITSDAYQPDSDALSQEHYAAAAHAVVGSDSGIPLLTAAQQRAGLSIDPAVIVQHFATLPLLLAENPGLIATIPETIAEGWASTWPIRIRPLPFEMPPIELSLYRRSTTQDTGALEWFFATVVPVLDASPGEFSALLSTETAGGGAAPERA